MGLYEAALVHGPCITYSRWRSLHPQFGEAGVLTWKLSKYCCGKVSNKMYLSYLKEGPFIYQFKCTLYLEFFLCFTKPSDGNFRQGTEAIVSFSSKPDSIEKNSTQLLVYRCLGRLVCFRVAR